MIILGIDPGTTSCGYAVIETSPRLILIEAGILPVATKDVHERLRALSESVTRIIKKQQPSCVAFERLFFAKNIKTALSVAEARGALLLTTTLAGCSVYDYTPLEVKKTVTGDGSADKLQVQKMVYLTLPETQNLKARDDVFDAIAIALTCYFKVEKNRYS